MSDLALGVKIDVSQVGTENFTKVEQALNELVTAIPQTTSTFENLTGSVKKTTNQLPQASDAIKEFSKNTTQNADSADHLASTLENLGLVLTATKAVELGKQLIALADNYSTLQTRVNAVVGSQELTKDVMSSLVEISAKTGATLATTAETYLRLAAATKSSGLNQQEMLTITSALNSAIKISGTTSAEASGALLQLSQAFSSGTLHGQEYNSVSSALPVILDAVASKMGITKEKLKELGTEGQLSTAVLAQSILAMAPTWDEQAKKIVTVDQSLNTLSVAFQAFAGQSAVVKTITSGLASLLQIAADNLSSLATAATVASGVKLATAFLSWADSTKQSTLALAAEEAEITKNNAATLAAALAKKADIQASLEQIEKRKISDYLLLESTQATKKDILTQQLLTTTTQSLTAAISASNLSTQEKFAALNKLVAVENSLNATTASTVVTETQLVALQTELKTAIASSSLSIEQQQIALGLLAEVETATTISTGLLATAFTGLKTALGFLTGSTGLIAVFALAWVATKLNLFEAAKTSDELSQSLENQGKNVETLTQKQLSYRKEIQNNLIATLLSEIENLKTTEKSWLTLASEIVGATNKTTLHTETEAKLEEKQKALITAFAERTRTQAALNKIIDATTNNTQNNTLSFLALKTAIDVIDKQQQTYIKTQQNSQAAQQKNIETSALWAKQSESVGAALELENKELLAQQATLTAQQTTQQARLNLETLNLDLMNKSSLATASQKTTQAELVAVLSSEIEVTKSLITQNSAKIEIQKTLIEAAKLQTTTDQAAVEALKSFSAQNSDLTASNLTLEDSIKDTLSTLGEYSTQANLVTQSLNAQSKEKTAAKLIEAEYAANIKTINNLELERKDIINKVGDATQKYTDSLLNQDTAWVGLGDTIDQLLTKQTNIQEKLESLAQEQKRLTSEINATGAASQNATETETTREAALAKVKITLDALSASMATANTVQNSLLKTIQAENDTEKTHIDTQIELAKIAGDNVSVVKKEIENANLKITTLEKTKEITQSNLDIEQNLLNVLKDTQGINPKLILAQNLRVETLKNTQAQLTTNIATEKAHLSQLELEAETQKDNSTKTTQYQQSLKTLDETLVTLTETSSRLKEKQSNLAASSQQLTALEREKEAISEKINKTEQEYTNTTDKSVESQKEYIAKLTELKSNLSYTDEAIVNLKESQKYLTEEVAIATKADKEKNTIEEIRGKTLILLKDALKDATQKETDNTAIVKNSNTLALTSQELRLKELEQKAKIAETTKEASAAIEAEIAVKKQEIQVAQQKLKNDIEDYNQLKKLTDAKIAEITQSSASTEEKKRSITILQQTLALKSQEVDTTKQQTQATIAATSAEIKRLDAAKNAAEWAASDKAWEEAKKAIEAAQAAMGNAIASMASDYKQLGGSLNDFYASIKHGTDYIDVGSDALLRLQQSYKDFSAQIQTFEDKNKNATLTINDLNQAEILLAQNAKYSDDALKNTDFGQAYRRLKDDIDAAKNAMLALEDEAANALRSAQDELDNILGNKLAIEERAYQKKKEDLDKQLDAARKIGDQKAIDALLEAERIQEEIHKKRIKQIEDELAASNIAITDGKNNQLAALDTAHNKAMAYIAAERESRLTDTPTSKAAHYATGGIVPGIGDEDTVPAWLTPGEVVIPKQEVAKTGLDNIKRQFFASGGEVESPKDRAIRLMMESLQNKITDAQTSGDASQVAKLQKELDDFNLRNEVSTLSPKDRAIKLQLKALTDALTTAQTSGDASQVAKLQKELDDFNLRNEVSTLSPKDRAIKLHSQELEAQLTAAHNIRDVEKIAALEKEIDDFKKKSQHFARGGIVPGIGDEDTVPAWLTPGEVVIPKQDVGSNKSLDNLITAINNLIAKNTQINLNLDGKTFASTLVNHLTNSSLSSMVRI
jgi:tape measure domain-containing protein